MTPSPTLKLNDGRLMPVIGLGTAHPRAFHSYTTVINALDIGYRHFDTAWAYGNQPELGDALRKGMMKLGLKREEIFVTSKVTNSHHTKENAVKNCQDTLDQLKFDYVDLLLIHWPLGFKEGADDHYPTDENGKCIYSDVDFLETWQGLEECLKRGMAKSIGVSNFNIKGIERILANCKVKPTVNQVECHPYMNRQELLHFCKGHNIILTTYGPLGAPYSQQAFNVAAVDRNLHLLEDPLVREVAKKHNKTPAQVSLRWAVQRGTVPLPRSNNKLRLAQNFAIFNFELSGEEMGKIDGLNQAKQAYPSSRFSDHPFYEYSL